VANKLDKDIQDAIQRHLPAQVAGILKGELEELLDIREKLVKEQAETVKFKGYWTQTVQERDDFGKKLKVFLERESALALKERDIALKESAIALKELENKIIKEHKKEILELVQMVFKGPQYQKTIEGYLPVPLEGQIPNSNGYGSQVWPSVGQGQVNIKEEINTK